MSKIDELDELIGGIADNTKEEKKDLDLKEQQRTMDEETSEMKSRQ